MGLVTIRKQARGFRIQYTAWLLRGGLGFDPFAVLLDQRDETGVGFGLWEVVLNAVFSDTASVIG